LASSLFSKAKRLFGGDAQPAPVPVRKTAASHHAVAIAPGQQACAAARALQGQRFLSREAPALPLRKCNCAACQCRYEHYDDRRKGSRRARDFGVSIDGYDGPDVRQKGRRGRRTTDR